MYTTQLIAAGTLLFSSALGLPKAMPQSTSNPTPSWLNSDQGNITIVLGDTTMNWGDQAPSDVLGQLYTQCYDQGTCNPNPFTVQANAPASPAGIDPFTLSLNVQDSFYPTWVKNGLIEMLQAAASSAATSQNVTVDMNGICTSGPDCIYQPPEQLIQYTFPNAISVIYENPNPADGPLGVINIGISLVQEQGDGFCQDFTTIGSAVAGAINGAAGGIFTLLGLACAS